MPFEKLLAFRFAAPPAVVADVIFRLGIAEVAVFEERPPHFAPPPSCELEADVEMLERIIASYNLFERAEPLPLKNLGEGLKKALRVLRECTAGYEPNDVVKREALRGYIAKCASERGIGLGGISWVLRAARRVLETYKSNAYSEGPDTGRSFNAVLSEIKAKEEELARLHLMLSFLEGLERQGYTSLHIPEGYRLIVNPKEPVRDLHQSLKFGDLDLVIVKGGRGAYGGVEIPREYVLDIRLSKTIIIQTIKNLEYSLNKLKLIYNNMVEIYKRYSVFGDFKWAEHSDVAVISFFVREKDLKVVDEILSEVLKGRFIPRQSISYKVNPIFKYIEYVQAPVSERWPYPIQAFNKILYMYGVPEPGELSPLPLVAFLFPLFFGWMFGDIGYGLLLLALSLTLFRLGKKDWGIVWLIASASTISFGAYYGEFLGLKLWGPDIETTYMTGIAASLLLGFYLMFLAFSLKIINRLLAKDYEASLALHAPIALLYASIGSRMLDLVGIEPYLRGRIGLDVLLDLCRFLASDPSLLLGTIWLALGLGTLAGKYGVSHLRDIGSEAVMAIIEAFVGATANVLSFARLAILVIVHSALSSAAYALLELPGGLPLYILTELGMAAFEGFLTAIQSLRLIYYETLSKFYRGSGRLFEPYKI